MICTLGLGPFRGQYSAPAGRNGFFKRHGISPAGFQPESPYPIAWNIPKARLEWILIPYTAHPAFGDGAPNVHTYARASWCPDEVDGRRAHISQLYSELSTPMAQLEWRLMPYTAHPGFGDGAPNVHTCASIWCPGEVDWPHTRISQLSLPSCQHPISNPRIPIISPQLNSRVRI